MYWFWQHILSPSLRPIEAKRLNVFLNCLRKDHQSSIYHQPSFSVCITDWKVSHKLTVADPKFFRPQHMDLLIGDSLFFDRFSIGQIKLAQGLPMLQKTSFSWVVSGGDQQCSKTTLFATESSLQEENETKTDLLLKRFWEIECCCWMTEKVKQEDIDRE